MLKLFIIIYMIVGLIISVFCGYTQYVIEDEDCDEELKSTRDWINQNASVVYVMLIWFLLWPAVIAAAIVCHNNHKNGGGSK